MALSLVSGAATYPVSLVEAKAHLRVDHVDDDLIIDLYIKAATQTVEQFLGRALIDQTWDYYADAFPASDGAITLPLSPTLEVVGVFYRDADGVEQELSVSGYTVRTVGESSIIEPIGSWPATQVASGALRVRFRSGYLDTSVSPQVGSVAWDIKAGILLTIGSLYANRETVVVGQIAVQIPWGIENLLRPHRNRLGMA